MSVIDAAPVGGSMHVKLACLRCGASLVPAFTGLRCPRLTACGFGGHVETIRRTSYLDVVGHGTARA